MDEHCDTCIHLTEESKCARHVEITILNKENMWCLGYEDEEGNTLTEDPN